MLFVKYEYEAKFGPCEELYDMAFDAEATIKDVRNKLNESFIFGGLQYIPYKIVNKKTEKRTTTENL